MFEDLIQEEPKEKPATPFCTHKLMQDKCPDFKNADDPKYTLCKHFGKLTSHCYKDVENV
jgi:hypothetical protein